MTNGSALTLTYVIYGIFSFALVTWLARTLFTHGAVFLEDVFPGRPELAGSTNRLLVVGFFMANLSFAFLLFQHDPKADAAQIVAGLISQLGVLLLILAVVHFLNMTVFWRIRGRALAPSTPPPARPYTPPAQSYIPPQQNTPPPPRPAPAG